MISDNIPLKEYDVKKTYVLDTNVLLYDPKAIQKFKEHDLVIPMTVIEEIDSFKKEMSDRGYAAREATRLLEELRTSGSLKKGIKLLGGGTIRVSYSDLPKSNDNLILKAVQDLKKDAEEVVLVSRDTNMRLKGDALGIISEDYQGSRITTEEGIYTGFSSIQVDSTTVDRLFDDGYIEWEGLIHNQFVMVKNGKHSGLGQVKEDRIHLIPKYTDAIWGIKPKNKEQTFAFHSLLDDSVKLTTICGPAGTGKTILALACGLYCTLEKKTYRKLLVSRPVFPMGKDLGYLPGDINEKLNPWMKPIYDNLEYLISGHTTNTRQNHRSPNYEYLFDSGIVEVEPLTYIRGRSIPSQFLLVDEAQNLTPHEIKTILTRAGEGTKIILVGDPDQIDNPYIDRLSNGLSYVIERFKGSHIASHITLTKGERSELASVASKLL